MAKNGTFIGCLETAPDYPTAKAMVITPEQALKWLEKPSFNVINRPVRQSMVDTWTEIMKRKQWKCNGDTIKISDDGKLLDGQHRLWACVYARTPFVAYVVEGLSQEVFDTIDVGYKRSGANMLSIHNRLSGSEPMKYEAAIMAAIMTCLEYKMGVWKARHTHTITHHDKLEFFKKNPDIAEWVHMSRVRGTKRWENRHSATIGATAFLGSKKYEMKARSFVSSFFDHEPLGDTSPIKHLRNRLSSDTQLEKWERMKLIVLVWNMHIENRIIKERGTLRMPDELPVIAGTEPPIKVVKEVAPKANKAPAVRRGRPPKAKEHAEIAYIRAK